MAVLRSPYLNGVVRLREVADGGKPLIAGETSVGVAQLQAALRDLGYPLTRSTAAGGTMDGFFGGETEGLLKQFQQDQRLPTTALGDALTIGAMDQALVLRLAAPIARVGRSMQRHSTRREDRQDRRDSRRQRVRPPKPLYGGSAVYADDGNYRMGTDDPVITPDPGAGGWKSKDKAYTVLAEYAAIQRVIEIGGPANAYPGPNAARHMRHYFGNSGLPLKIDLENMVKTVPLARDALITEFRQVQAFLRELPRGSYDFTSVSAQGSANTKAESPDWFFAIGSYSYWGKGRANIDDVDGQRRYDVEFTYRFSDRYNWDGGKSVNLGPIIITDEFMGEFHREGLAMEFDCYGSLTRRLRWLGDTAVPSDHQIVRNLGR